MKAQTALALLALSSSLATAAPVAEWTFNTDDGDITTGTLSPASGSGTLAVIGGATYFFGFGSPNDPAEWPLDSAWSVGGYPAQGTGSGTAGVEGWVSTAGYTDIVLSFDARTQPSGNRWFAVQASDNAGSAWHDIAVFDLPAANTWFTQSFNLSTALPSVNDNPDFGFRVVAIFQPGTSAYEAVEAGYNGDFGLEYDLLTVQATVVPEPAGGWLLLGGLLTCAGWQMRRRR